MEVAVVLVSCEAWGCGHFGGLPPLPQVRGAVGGAETHGSGNEWGGRCRPRWAGWVSRLGQLVGPHAYTRGSNRRTPHPYPTPTRRSSSRGF